MLNNSFLFDDFVHLYNVSNLPFLQAISVPMGGHLLHSFTTVVWSVKSLFGLNPVVFLLLGLAVHLASVWLLFGIVSSLTGRAALAAFGATLWGISPMNAGTLGWISVHGQLYATCAVLWVLHDIVRCSQASGQLSNGLLLRHALLLMVATTSFGAGLASTLVLPLLVALWNPVPAQRYRLVAVYGAAALAALVLYVTTMSLQGEAADNLGDKLDIMRRSFAIAPVIGRAFAELLAIGSAGLLWGPLVVGKISMVPKESLVLVASIATFAVTLPLLIWGCWVSDPSERRRIFALLLIPCAAYGLIAIARSGSFFVLHPDAARYHYLAPAILAVVLCLILSKLIDRLPARARDYGRISYSVWLILVLVPFALGPALPTKEAHMKWQKRQFLKSTQTLEKALENNIGQGDIFIRNRRFSVFVWGYTPEQFPGLAALFVVTYPNNIVDGRRVFFLEESEELVKTNQARFGSRISQLLIHKPKKKN